VTDISHRFSLSQINHHELLEILTLRYGTCWRVSEHEISFPASPDYCLQLKMRHEQIKRISAGASLAGRNEAADDYSILDGGEQVVPGGTPG
jgi:hypothetical protein